MKGMTELPLNFSVVASCSSSRARVGKMRLPHSIVDTPVFMPVGTQGTMKGVTPEQLKDPSINCQLLLGNTYHLANKPVSMAYVFFLSKNMVLFMIQPHT